MRSIQVEKVRDAVRDMCIEANYSLSPDMRCVFEKACQEENLLWASDSKSAF